MNAFVLAHAILALHMTDFCRPFTERELLAAFSFVMPATEARRLAAEWSSTTGAIAFGAKPEEICLVFSDDVLLLLSLVSDEVHQRVVRYRAELGPDEDGLSESEWNEHRNTIREELRRNGKLPPAAN